MSKEGIEVRGREGGSDVQAKKRHQDVNGGQHFVDGHTILVRLGEVTMGLFMMKSLS